MTEERPTLDKLIELARTVKMTPEEERKQRISFVTGNCKLDNPRITREMVEEADHKLEAERKAALGKAR